MGINADTTLEPPLDAAAADVLERVQDRNSKNRKNDRNLKVVVVAVVGVRNTNTCIQIHKQEKCAFSLSSFADAFALGLVFDFLPVSQTWGRSKYKAWVDENDDDDVVFALAWIHAI